MYTWTIDLTAPTVLSIKRAGPSPTNASTVSWTVKFSEDVTGVDAGDFALSRTGALTGGSIGDVTPLAGPGAYTVTSTTGTGDGTIGLSLVDDGSVSDDAGNPLKSGDFTGPSYAIDKTGPATAPGLPPAAGQPTSHTAVPAVPAITAKPAPLGNQTAADFRFTGEAGARLLCSLDHGSFAACTSPKPYSGLRAGSHTFQVEARNAAGTTGPAASYTWTIDTTPPSITVSFPAAGGVYNDKSWSNGCRGGTGACASAADASGIAEEEISILQRSGTRYWNGSAFNSPTETFKAFTGGRYPLSLLPDGLYTIRIRATDNAGNTTPAGAYRTVDFRIKTTKPPKPVLDSTPPDPTASPSANFTWHDAASPVTYLCSADNGSFSPTVPSQGRPRRPCASPFLRRAEDEQRRSSLRRRGRRRGGQRLRRGSVLVDGRRRLDQGLHDQRQRERTPVSGRPCEADPAHADEPELRGRHRHRAHGHPRLQRAPLRVQQHRVHGHPIERRHQATRHSGALVRDPAVGRHDGANRSAGERRRPGSLQERIPRPDLPRERSLMSGLGWNDFIPPRDVERPAEPRHAERKDGRPPRPRARADGWRPGCACCSSRSSPPSA